MSKTGIICNQENPECFQNLLQIQQLIRGRKGQKEIDGDQSDAVELFPFCQQSGRYPRAI